LQDLVIISILGSGWSGLGNGMKITKQTSTELVIKSRNRALVFTIGVILLLTGVLLVTLIRVRPLSAEELRPPIPFFQLEAEGPKTEADVENPSTANASYRLAYYFGQLTGQGLRPLIACGGVGILVGLAIIAGPYRRTVVKFDKAQHHLTLKQPRWFFRSKTEEHSFDDLADVRVERDRLNTRENSYGVTLVFSHNEGAPLSPNFIQYKTVFFLSESFRYDYGRARDMVDSIKSFLTAV
jgi:hypothetical protein